VTALGPCYCYVPMHRLAAFASGSATAGPSQTGLGSPRFGFLTKLELLVPVSGVSSHVSREAKQEAFPCDPPSARAMGPRVSRYQRFVQG
jgi:hypothetical protein